MGRTEQVKDTLSPAWQHKFVVDYKFEERQLVKFAVYDWDGKSSDLRYKYNTIHNIICNKIYNTIYNTIQYNLQDNTNYNIITSTIQ